MLPRSGSASITCMSKRGFAALDPDKQREIARLGGRAAHAQGKAHEFTSEEARVAGRKGGEVVSNDKEHMKEIGRMGGRAKRRKRSEIAQAAVAPGG
jgi:general stress protein YciG